MNNQKIKNELSAKVILIIAVVSYILKFLIGGIIGDSFALLGLICLIFGLIKLYRENRANKANAKNPKSISSVDIPKTNFQNFIMIPHIESLINYFINHEKQVSLINSDCIITLFQKGYVPASEEFNNPQKMSTIDPSVKIDNPQKWLLSRLWLDLINLKNISEKTNVSLNNIFVDYLNNLGPKIDQTLITYGTLAQKYNIDDLEGDWEEKINRLADKGERESFKINYVSDTLLSAEVRIIAWIYKELFNKEFKFKK